VRTSRRSYAAHSIQNPLNLFAREQGEHGRFAPGQVRAFPGHAGGALRKRRDCATAKQAGRREELDDAGGKEFFATAQQTFCRIPLRNRLVAKAGGTNARGPGVELRYRTRREEQGVRAFTSRASAPSVSAA